MSRERSNDEVGTIFGEHKGGPDFGATSVCENDFGKVNVTTGRLKNSQIFSRW